MPNLRNKRFSKNFLSDLPYKSKADNREVRVYRSLDGSAGYTLGLLHGNAIVKREGGHLYISYAGWRTPTTTLAIKACLPPAWSLSAGVLVSPQGARMNVKDTWTRVQEPGERYLEDFMAGLF